MGNPRTLESSNFEGAALAQMRGWVEGGSGAQALFDKAEVWGEEQKFMRDLAERVKARLAKANAVIESKSGEAMQNAVSPVVLWTEVTADNAQVQQTRMQEQGDAFNRVKAAIPKKEEEVPVPDDNFLEEGWDSLVNGKTDAEAAKAKNEALRQEAVTAFNGYQSTSQNSVAASAVFTAPPPGGMETSVASGPQAPVGGISAASFGGGSGQAAGTQSSWAGGGVPAGSGADYGQHAGRVPAGTTPSSYAPIADPGARNQDWQRQQELQRQQQLRAQQGLAGGPSGSGAGAGPGGRGTGAGGRAGAGGSAGGRGAGAGGRSGLGTGGAAGPGSARPGGMAGAGARGGGVGAMGGGAPGRGQQGGEDQEHETPDFLKGDQGVFNDDLPKVAPPVFGEPDQK
jgi:hypothetical protein